MSLTGLESILLAALISAVVGMIIRVRSVSPHDCEERRRLVGEGQHRIEAALEGLKLANDIQFRMLRAFVAHSDLPANTKAEILNMGPTKEK